MIQMFQPTFRTFGRALPVASLALALSASATAQTGQLYSLTNATAGNEVAVFDRAADGAVTFNALVATGGTGTGAGLGNQGAVILTQDERFLIAVNAGSSDLSVFRVEEAGLTLVDVEPARGLRPVSVTQHDDLVYAVNAGTDSIAGFHFDFDGNLTPLVGGLARLTSMSSAPAQIEFGPRGQHLYVTEKASNRIVRYGLNETGEVTSRGMMSSPGNTPFGFAFGVRGQLFVSEAHMGAAGASTVSAYRQIASGELQIIDASVPTGETAVCWIVPSPNGRLVFASNTGSNSISSFAVAFDGSLTLLDAQAAASTPGALDMAVTPDSRFLYVLDGATGVIGDYVVGTDGSLTGIPGSQAVLPMGASGLAVR